MSLPDTIHATTIALGEAGILIRGEPGSGKSSLARQLLGDARALRIFSLLVADDRTRVEERHGRLVARAVTAVAGCIEIRGIGIVRRAAEPAVVVRLIVDLSEGAPERLPERTEGTVAVCGVLLPRIRAQTGANLTDIVMEHIGGLCDAPVTE
ncbi:HPr kinase/phosphorylase [Microvirga brassicacearum]|uniref:Serine/threonine protein kinase n=1 Tax=Microvirga brassicacearum TaxID=2580413 RepID=A0A5N3PFI3_9HYPH|nr:serine/threonine protein kinase [Microvirga brassicacearum]KAB0268395.1 serine/threonine protein kinase [Microvirga brassicacearum]